jgi:hypothetical protein
VAAHLEVVQSLEDPEAGLEVDLEEDRAARSLEAVPEIEESLVEVVLAGNPSSMGSAEARSAWMAVAFPLEQMAAFPEQEHSGLMQVRTMAGDCKVRFLEVRLTAGEERSQSAVVECMRYLSAVVHTG